MKWLPLMLLFACSSQDDAPGPSLEAGYTCGTLTCGENEYCRTESSGSQCQVNPDAGIGQYQTYAWECVPVPAACNSFPDCVCDSADFCTVSTDERTIDHPCI